ncbi:hypothetical protein JMUB6875_41540 [Nocardia sp. JMUB6875]|uniref:carboxymuconolactone decarboxylase family protein n=1 Tax=Nocardia sp. JMUB6875 TaxID=3158170 RepID=UPI0032E599B6
MSAWRIGPEVVRGEAYRQGIGRILRGIRFTELEAPDCRLAAQRTAWLSGGTAVWNHLHDNRSELVINGPADPRWTPRQRTLLLAVDELYRDRYLSDDTWAALDLTPPQRVDLCFLVGVYTAIALLANSFDRDLDQPAEVVPLRAGRTTEHPRWLLPETPRLPNPGPGEAGAVYRWFSSVIGALNGGGSVDGVAMFGRSPVTFTTLLPFVARAGAVRLARDLSELVTLRATWNAGSQYHRGHHGRAAEFAGLSPAEIDRVAAGPEDSGWSEDQRLVLCAVDDLQIYRRVGDDTWKRLTVRFTTWQIHDILVIVANYETLCMALNSFGIRFEENAWRGGLLTPLWAALRARGRRAAHGRGMVSVGRRIDADPARRRGGIGGHGPG